MEKNVDDECEGLSEQRKAVAFARVRLHEQQMELSLQASSAGPGLRGDVVADTNTVIPWVFGSLGPELKLRPLCRA